MTKEMRVIAGLDIGNGYVKGKVSVDGSKPIMIDMPSVVSYTAGSSIPKEYTPKYVESFENEMDATIISPQVQGIDAGRVLFGRRAIKSGGNIREFNIENHVPKCQDALSTMLILGSVASSAIRAYCGKHNALPSELSVDACIGIALPIEDFMDWKDVYSAKLMGSAHTVNVQNFGQNIPVTIKFSAVTPLAEGAAAQYAITSLGADFLQAALDDARAMGAHIDAAYTGEMLASIQNTIGIDVGEGTVNFPVFMDAQVNIEASSSINKGYGTVLTEVVAETRNRPGLSFDNRKALADFMLDDSNIPAKVKRRAALQKVVDEQVNLFVRDVLREFTNIYRKTGAQIDAVYIYGGGAGQIRDALYGAVLAETADETGDSIPVIYLDSSYSRDLNRTGLYQVAELVAGNVWK